MRVGRASSVMATTALTLAVAATLFALAANPADAGERNRPAVSRADVDTINARLRRGRVIRVEAPLETAALAIPADTSYAHEVFALPSGLPIVHIEVPSDEMMARGQTAAAGAAVEAIVFLQGSDSAFFLLQNGGAADGNFQANQMWFGNSFKSGDALSGYDLLVANRSDDASSGPTTVTVSLWDGDPLGMEDVECAESSGPAPIPGTQATFTDLPVGAAFCDRVDTGREPSPGCVGVFRLRHDFAAKIPLQCNRVWMVMERIEGCRLGWRINGSPNSGGSWQARPTIGFSDFIEERYDNDGVGTCCGVAGATIQGFCDRSRGHCDPARGDADCPAGETCVKNVGLDPGQPCDHTDASTSNDCVHEAFCTDGEAEFTTAFFFGAAFGTGYYASLVATVRAPANATISLVPLGNDRSGGLDPGTVIEGNEMTMLAGGRRVFIEARIGDWDPQDLGVATKAFQIAIDSSGYSLSASVPDPEPLECLTDTDCLAMTGVGNCEEVPACGSAAVSCAQCATFGAPCTCSAPSLPAQSLRPAIVPCWGPNRDTADAVCDTAFGRGATCQYPADCDFRTPGACACTPLFMDEVRSDFLIHVGICAAQLSSLDYKWGCSVVVGDIHDPEPFPERGMYGGTLVLEIPADALGTYTLDINPGPNTSLRESGAGSITLLGLVPAKLTIVNCAKVDAPEPEPSGHPKGRYLSFLPGNANRVTAIRVTFSDLPFPYDALNGETMWVGEPRLVSESGGVVDPVDAPEFATFMAATLQCSPYHADWSTLGAVHVSHDAIVPGATYLIQALDSDCGTNSEAEFSAALELTTSSWGDVCGPSESRLCEAGPDGRVDIVSDILGVLNGFSNRPTAIAKVRVDLEPATPDRKIQILDAVMAIDAFRGLPYPFVPATIAPCSP